MFAKIKRFFLGKPHLQTSTQSLKDSLIHSDQWLEDVLSLHHHVAEKLTRRKMSQLMTADTLIDFVGYVEHYSDNKALDKLFEDIVVDDESLLAVVYFITQMDHFVEIAAQLSELHISSNRLLCKSKEELFRYKESLLEIIELSILYRLSKSQLDQNRIHPALVAFFQPYFERLDRQH